MVNFNFENWLEGCWLSDAKKSLIGPAVLLFEKIDDNVIEAQIKKLMDTKEENEASAAKVIPVKKEINYDDFMKMDLRVGEILNAESVPRSNKLLKFTVDTGLDRRTIVSGIAKHFSSQEMVGKKVMVLLNLALARLWAFLPRMILLLKMKMGPQTCISGHFCHQWC